MSEKLRVAVIGAGQIANSAHIPAWKSTEGVEIVAVVDNRENVAEITAKRYNIPNVYKDYKVMLEEIKPDIVSVCTPNNFHKPCAIAALEAGAHVLCEKPLSVSEKDAREMYDVAHRCGKYQMASQSMRFDTRTKAAKALYDTGIVGDPYYVQANLVRRRGIPKWGFFHMKEYNTAGPGFDLGVHVLDLLLWFMGSPAPISVSGRNYEKSFFTGGNCFQKNPRNRLLVPASLCRFTYRCWNGCGTDHAFFCISDRFYGSSSFTGNKS